jgi:hypothetical protein
MIGLKADDILAVDCRDVYVPKRYGPMGGGGYRQLTLTVKYLLRDENTIKEG